MNAEELILTLDKHFSRVFRNSTVPAVKADVRTEVGVVSVTITRRGWAKCVSRFDRWDLLRGQLR